MKKLFSLFAAILIASSAFAGKNVTLRDVMYGGYWPQTYAVIKPMADGEHFARMSDDRTMILKGSFKNGEIIDTLFNAATARGFNEKRIDGYQFSPNEKLILLQTKTVGIYRNSYTNVQIMKSTGIKSPQTIATAYKKLLEVGAIEESPFHEDAYLIHTTHLYVPMSVSVLRFLLAFNQYIDPSLAITTFAILARMSLVGKSKPIDFTKTTLSKLLGLAK